MNAFDLMNLVIMLIFVLCCFYQVLYIPISWWKKPKAHQPEKLHRYAVLVAARNEEIVIGNLIESLRQQDYPSELVDIYVMADNCTDHTAEAARKAGASPLEAIEAIENADKDGSGSLDQWGFTKKAQYEVSNAIKSNGFDMDEFERIYNRKK